MSRISVVIPVFNKWDLTANCLRSLAEHSYGADLQVIVTDNASSDATASLLEPLGQDLFGCNFKHLRFEQNLNYGPACNAGAQIADGDLLFLLNNDTLLTPDWLLPLLEELQRPGTAGVGPLLTYADNTVQHLGICISCLGNKVFHLYARIAANHPLAQKKRSFPAITAAALLLPRASFLEVGGFFPDYVNGFEDVDLGLKLSANGSVLRINPASRIYHLEGQSASRHSAEAHNSKLLSSRWNMILHENMTRIAVQDGYELRIDPMLNAVFALPEAKQLDLLNVARCNRSISLPIVFDLLETEPMWESGYLLLADGLAATGQVEQALRVVVTGFDFVMSFALLEKAAALVDLLPDCDLRAGLAGISQRYQEEKNRILDQAAFAARVGQLKGALEQSRNPLLAKALAQANQQAVALRHNWAQAVVNPALKD